MGNGYKLSVQRFPGSFGGQAFVMIGWCYPRHPLTVLKSNACPPKRFQKSLHRKLVPIPLLVSGVGNSDITVGSSFQRPKTVAEVKMKIFRQVAWNKPGKQTNNLVSVSGTLSPTISINFKEGRTGGISRTVHEQKKQRITDHGYQNFIFPNHENKQVRYSF